MIDITCCMKISEIVDIAREVCDIKTPKHEMVDDEIRTAMRWIGAGGLRWISG